MDLSTGKYKQFATFLKLFPISRIFPNVAQQIMDTTNIKPLHGCHEIYSGCIKYFYPDAAYFQRGLNRFVTSPSLLVPTINLTIIFSFTNRLRKSCYSKYTVWSNYKDTGVNLCSFFSC